MSLAIDQKWYQAAVPAAAGFSVYPLLQPQSCLTGWRHFQHNHLEAAANPVSGEYSQQLPWQPQPQGTQLAMCIHRAALRRAATAAATPAATTASPAASTAALVVLLAVTHLNTRLPSRPGGRGIMVMAV